MEIHAGSKPYSLGSGVCGKSVRIQVDLLEHVRTHTGGQSYSYVEVVWVVESEYSSKEVTWRKVFDPGGHSCLKLKKRKV